MAALAIGVLAMCAVLWQQPVAGGLTLLAYGLVYTWFSARDSGRRGS